MRVKCIHQRTTLVVSAPHGTLERAAPLFGGGYKRRISRWTGGWIALVALGNVGGERSWVAKWMSKENNKVGVQWASQAMPQRNLYLFHCVCATAATAHRHKEGGRQVTYTSAKQRVARQRATMIKLQPVVSRDDFVYCFYGRLSEFIEKRQKVQINF